MMTLPVRPVLAIGAALAVALTEGVSQGVAPLRLGGRVLEPAPPAPFSSRLGVLSLRTHVRVAAVLPTCTMPVVVPDLTRSERMPGSHIPDPASVGPEYFGCTNPRGPEVARAPVHP